jgi:hypothetical protein
VKDEQRKASKQPNDPYSARSLARALAPPLSPPLSLSLCIPHPTLSLPPSLLLYARTRVQHLDKCAFDFVLVLFTDVQAGAVRLILFQCWAFDLCDMRYRISVSPHIGFSVGRLICAICDTALLRLSLTASRTPERQCGEGLHQGAGDERERERARERARARARERERERPGPRLHATGPHCGICVYHDLP